MFTNHNTDLDSNRWKCSTLIRCSASLWSQPHCLCPVTELAFLSLPQLETEASSASGCSTAFGTLHLRLVFFALGYNPQTHVLQPPQSQSAPHPEEQERFREGKLSHRGMSQLIHRGNSMFLTVAEKETLSIIKNFPVSLLSHIQYIEKKASPYFLLLHEHLSIKKYKRKKTPRYHTMRLIDWFELLIFPHPSHLKKS